MEDGGKALEASAQGVQGTKVFRQARGFLPGVLRCISVNEGYVGDQECIDEQVFAYSFSRSVQDDVEASEIPSVLRYIQHHLSVATTNTSSCEPNINPFEFQYQLTKSMAALIAC